MRAAFALLVAAGLAAPVHALEVPVCPFKPAELEAALGEKFADGKPGMAYGAGGIDVRSCQYDGRRWSLRVGMQVYKNPPDAKKFGMVLAGKLVPVAGDPDGAVFQEGQGDNTSPTVWYERKGVAVELRAMGLWYSDPSKRQAEMEALRGKMAKLRRVP
ncbi:MAG: hypothetical protein O9345_18905 [Burkholderiaceae bacterium]|jgi:hypothetical protein|nr:hypothetical protein [Burkholderiales bacterium]MCZ8100094.1 hypothetical protein [Burkholderiales bacterium]MCZ8340190.1 hypothetical protein [Burkholderiaceae bacterium]